MTLRLKALDPASEHLLPLDLLERAEDFFDASRRVGNTVRLPSWPRYFLLCHAIEVALKAWLAWSGESAKRLEHYGHDLDKLVAVAQTRGFTGSGSAVNDIRLLSPVHKEHLARYPLRTGAPIPMIEQFEGTAVELLEAGCAARGHAKRRLFVSY